MSQGTAIEHVRFPWQLVQGRCDKTKRTKALVVGTGPTARADLSAIDLSEFETFAVNQAVFQYNFVKWHHVVTWHPENYVKWYEQYLRQGGRKESWPKTHCPKATWQGKKHEERYRWPITVNCVWETGNPKGSSALVAVGIAMSIGYDPVIVAGCPLSEKYQNYRRGWLNHHWLLDGHVYGVSGFIADEFGRYEDG
jgi:hypothetical protein